MNSGGPSRKMIIVLGLLIVGLSFGVVFFLWFLDQEMGRLYENWRPKVAAVAIMNLLLGLLPVAVLVRNGRLFTMHQLVSLFSVLVFAVWPFYLILADGTKLWVLTGIRNPYALLFASLKAAFWGILAFQIGYLLPIGRRLASQLPAMRSNWDRRRSRQVIGCLTLIMGTSLLLMWRFVGGASEIMKNPTRLRGAFAGEFYITLGVLVAPVVILIFLARGFQTGKPSLTVWILALVYSIVSLFLGSRSNIVGLWLGIYLLFVLIRRQRSLFSILAVTLALVVLGLVGVVGVGEFRRLGGGSLDLADYLTSPEMRFGGENTIDLFLREFGEIEIFAYALKIFPEEMPFLYGRSYLDLFFQIVPRSIWPEKPLPSGFLLGDIIFGKYVGAPATILGDLYINFGHLGVVVGMIAFGVVCNLLDRWYRLHYDNSGVLALYVFMLTAAFKLVARSFLSTATSIVLFIVPAVLLVRYVSRPDQKSPPAQTIETSTPKPDIAILGLR